ncbi:MAG: hypothetical protein JWP47_864 [Polaromonas sp.]|nr:hypothetical protein [Polaromonas sp.]
MLYKFKSKNASDVIMLEPNARHILEIIGKTPGPKGIIEPAQMTAAIAALEAAVAEEEEAHRQAEVHQDARNEDSGISANNPGLRQRAVPFIQMLQANLKAGSSVMWGV